MNENQSDSTLKVGELFAERYLIERLLGIGGMGDVYLAKDTLLGGEERIALKVLHRQLSNDERQSKRFLREVQLTRKVTHSNIVRTFDAGKAGNQLYLTMEYVTGSNLKDLLDRVRPNFEQCCLILDQMCDGLAAIHAAGIVHRDLKPANVLLLEDGTIKIGDFGVARLGWSDLTAADEVVGSAVYLSPEQWTGKELGPAADLYSLGIIAYELFSGSVPFDADSPAEMMCKHLDCIPTPLAESIDGMPLEVSRLVDRLLAKDSQSRPQSALNAKQQLQDALRNNLELSRSERPHEFNSSTKLPPPSEEPTADTQAELADAISADTSIAGVTFPASIPPPPIEEIYTTDVTSDSMAKASNSLGLSKLILGLLVMLVLMLGINWIEESTGSFVSSIAKNEHNNSVLRWLATIATYLGNIFVLVLPLTIITSIVSNRTQTFSISIRFAAIVLISKLLIELHLLAFYDVKISQAVNPKNPGIAAIVSVQSFPHVLKSAFLIPPRELAPRPISLSDSSETVYSSGLWTVWISYFVCIIAVAMLLSSHTFRCGIGPPGSLALSGIILTASLPAIVFAVLLLSGVRISSLLAFVGSNPLSVISIDYLDLICMIYSWGVLSLACWLRQRNFPLLEPVKASTENLSA